MKSVSNTLSIRTRLLAVYIGILLVGFGVLTLVAGQQISAGVREDYEERLKSEISLIAQAISPLAEDFMDGRISEADLQAAVKTYGDHIGGTLTFIPLRNQGGSPLEPHGRFGAASELDTALNGQIALDERSDEVGENHLYTAAQVVFDGRMLGLLQMSVPSGGLQALLAQRWLVLLLIVAFVALLGVAAALWLARSIIQPLYKLRESALRLSRGDFSHRIDYAEKDEIGEVAHAFNEMAAQVESMLEEQRAFASNTSHELRTPLTTIRLRTEALRYDQTLESDVAKRYIAEIDDEAMRLGNLIQDLTLLSRLDAGRAELGQEQVDMLRFAASLCNQMRAAAKEKDISITLTVPDEPVAMNASINHLTVVFRNLLDNAIKYTPSGGEIAWVIQKSGAEIRHTISDLGHGIETDYLPHIFERFYRVDKARSRDIPGTGLGLALVKSIVEAYGGRISIVSGGLDRGTTAAVIVPQSLDSSG